MLSQIDRIMFFYLESWQYSIMWVLYIYINIYIWGLYIYIYIYMYIFIYGGFIYCSWSFHVRIFELTPINSFIHSSIFFIHSSICWWNLGCLYNLTFQNNAIMEMRMQITYWLEFLWKYSQKRDYWIIW
jgi:hypothetical protein